MDKALNYTQNFTELPLGQNNVRINFKKTDSSSKEFAFMKAHELNNIEHLTKVKCDLCNTTGYINTNYNGTHDNNEQEKCYRCNGYGHYYTKNIWRTGKNTCKQLIIETDNPSTDNLSLIVNHLQKLFGYKFNAIKTLHGYHIIGSKIYPNQQNLTTHKTEANLEWFLDNAKILNNDLNIFGYHEYVTKILDMDQELREYQPSTNYKNLFTTSLRNSGLLHCIGDFDVLYTVLSIKYGKSTLRISKKRPEDKYEEVKI